MALRLSATKTSTGNRKAVVGVGPEPSCARLSNSPRPEQVVHRTETRTIQLSGGLRGGIRHYAYAYRLPAVATVPVWPYGGRYCCYPLNNACRMRVVHHATGCLMFVAVG